MSIPIWLSQDWQIAEYHLFAVEGWRLERASSASGGALFEPEIAER
jgi:hypothetical protein